MYPFLHTRQDSEEVLPPTHPGDQPRDSTQALGSGMTAPPLSMDSVQKCLMAELYTGSVTYPERQLFMFQK